MNLSVSHPDIAKQWHSTKNRDLQPEQFTSGSGKKLISEKSIYVYDSDETRVSEALNPVLVR